MKKNMLSGLLTLGIIGATVAAGSMSTMAAVRTNEPIKHVELNEEEAGAATTVETEASAEKAKEKKKKEYQALTEFTARTIDGEEFTSEDLEEKELTILYVWSTTCGYCIEEMPDLKEYAETLPENVQFVTYCADGEYLSFSAKKILEKNELSDYVTIVSGDGDFETLNSQLLYTPTTLFVDSEGNVLDAIVGAPENLAEAYDEVLTEVLPEEAAEEAAAETEQDAANAEEDAAETE